MNSRRGSLLARGGCIGILGPRGAARPSISLRLSLSLSHTHTHTIHLSIWLVLHLSYIYHIYIYIHTFISCQPPIYQQRTRHKARPTHTRWVSSASSAKVRPIMPMSRFSSSGCRRLSLSPLPTHPLLPPPSLSHIPPSTRRGNILYICIYDICIPVFTDMYSGKTCMYETREQTDTGKPTR
jgi:hypothetical protein